MAPDTKSHIVAAASSSRDSAQQEEEVYGMLGALLGTLEVVATDDAHPLSDVQAARMRSAVRLCYRMQHQVEALLTLAIDELALRRHLLPLRPLVEHALRGAVRTFEARDIALELPSDEDDWGSERVAIDPSRVDRMLKALAEALAGSCGQGGAIHVHVEAQDRCVALVLTGRAGTPFTGKQVVPEASLESSLLLRRGAAKLFALLGGSFAFDAGALRMRIELPRPADSEAP